MKIDIIAGARPNFMKIAPIIHEIERTGGSGLSYRLIHTGQHYDKNMSLSFFEDLGIPAPAFNLEAGGGTQAEQTAKIMCGYEELVLADSPDLCLVVGDVTSTLACSVVAKKAHVKVAHVEAGIRSGDLRMPEEINRLVTDSITDYFFTTTPLATENLRKAGVAEERIFWVGNTMIDTLLKQRPRFRQPAIWQQLELQEKGYIVLTLHRPSNVDGEKQLEKTLATIINSSNGVPIIFPVHPRTKSILQNLDVNGENLHYADPMPYLEFNYLVERAKAVVTDSGGITEETTVMGVPCMTLRDSTERPETITEGTNELLGVDPEAIVRAFKKLLGGIWKEGKIPEKWDGSTAKRIVEILKGL